MKQIRPDQSFMKCDDCGNKFIATLRDNQTYVRCPKCKSENTDFDKERELNYCDYLAKS